MAFIKVAKVGDLKPNTGTFVPVGGKRIALFFLGDEYCATDDGCTHSTASLSCGWVDPATGCVVCPRHGAPYHIKTGKAQDKGLADLQTYPTRVVGEDVEIDV